MNLQRNWGADLWQSRQSRSAFTSLGMKADLKCETIDLLQSRQKGSTEAELPIFDNEGRVLVKPIFRSLAVKIERKCKSETSNLWKSRQRWNAEAELQIFGSPGRTSAENGTSDLCQSRQSGSAEAELHIFGSQGRAEVRKRNFTFCRTKMRIWNFRSLAVKTERKRNFRSLAVKAEWKCGSGTSGPWQSRQSRSVEAEFQIFSRQDRAEVRKQYCRSLTVQSDCYIEGQCEDQVWLKWLSQCVWQGQYAPARAQGNTRLKPLAGLRSRLRLDVSAL